MLDSKDLKLSLLPRTLFLATSDFMQSYECPPIQVLAMIQYNDIGLLPMIHQLELDKIGQLSGLCNLRYIIIYNILIYEYIIYNIMLYRYGPHKMTPSPLTRQTVSGTTCSVPLLREAKRGAVL